MPESFFKVDVNLLDHPKIVGLSDAAFRVYVASIGYANRLMTDGFIAGPIARRLHDCDWSESTDTPEAHAKELVAAGLWEPVSGGWHIHDFLDHNRSKDERLADRDKERDRKAAYRKRQRESDGTDDPGDGGVPPGQGRGVPPGRLRHGDAMSRRIETETETETEGQINTIVEHDAADAAPARPVAVHPATELHDVFTAWKATLPPGSRHELTDARRDAIKQARQRYPFEDVLDAVRGWPNDPWAERCQHNDIPQLLWMGSKRKPQNVLEKMRDLYRHGPPATFGKRTQQLVANQQGMRAVGMAKGVIASGNGMATVGELGRPDQRELARPADRTVDRR